MHKLIHRLFEKRGIKDVNDLSDEERVKAEEWDQTLREDEVTAGGMAEFCESQMAAIEKAWQDNDLPAEKIARLTVLHTAFKKLHGYITGRKLEREALIKYLKQQLG